MQPNKMQYMVRQLLNVIASPLTSLDQQRGCLRLFKPTHIHSSCDIYTLDVYVLCFNDLYGCTAGRHP